MTEHGDVTGPARERDPSGRPRNARPRDAMGRPLPRGAAGAAQLPDAPALPPADALRYAQRLLEQDRPFQAHEVLEACWKAAPAPERELWRGLAQIAVGLTHAGRGNATGAVALLTRGAQRVAPYATSPPHGLDPADIAHRAASLAARIGQDGPAAAAGTRFSLLPASR